MKKIVLIVVVLTNVVPAYTMQRHLGEALRLAGVGGVTAFGLRRVTEKHIKAKQENEVSASAGNVK